MDERQKLFCSVVKKTINMVFLDHAPLNLTTVGSDVGRRSCSNILRTLLLLLSPFFDAIMLDKVVKKNYSKNNHWSHPIRVIHALSNILKTYFKTKSSIYVSRCMTHFELFV